MPNDDPDEEDIDMELNDEDREAIAADSEEMDYSREENTSRQCYEESSSLIEESKTQAKLNRKKD